MAYGLLLYKEIETPQGTQRLEIYKDGYTGEAIELQGLHRDGITISKDSQSLAQAITTSVLTISLSDCGEVDYSQFFTPNSTLFKVVWLTDNETRWTGFITPDSFTENLAYRDTLTLTARDNIGRLNDYDFSITRGQMMSVRDIVTAGLGVAGVAMRIKFETLKLANSPATIFAIDGLVNTTLLQGMTWHAAVELLLSGLGMTMSWQDANTIEIRDIAQRREDSQDAFFISKSGYRQIRPAWKDMNIGQDYGLRSNFYEGQMDLSDCGGTGANHWRFYPPGGSKWDYNGEEMQLLNPYNGAQSPIETIFLPILNGLWKSVYYDSITYTHLVPRMQRAINLRMKFSNSGWAYFGPAPVEDYPDQYRATDTSIQATGMLLYKFGHGDGGQWDDQIWVGYGLRYRLNVFFTDTVGNRYILRDSWVEYTGLENLEEPYLYFDMPNSWTGLNLDNEVQIYIGETPAAGTLEVVFYEATIYERGGQSQEGQPQLTTIFQLRAFARVTDIVFEVDEGVAGITKNIAINADHNMRGEVAVGMGQVPSGCGNSLLYLGGLFYDDDYYTPLASFQRDENGEIYDLLELVAREYISYQNAAYNALSGTMMADAAFRFDKGVTFDENDYRIVGAALSILSNTLQAQMLQQEADFDETDYTITTVDSEGTASRTGTGTTGQGTPGTSIDIADIETTYAAGIAEAHARIASIEDWLRDAAFDELYANTMNAAEVNARRIWLSDKAYFEVDEDGYIHTNYPLYSDSWISAGGVNPGGGGGGGDLDLGAMWSSLVNGTISTAAVTSGTDIHPDHLPTLQIAGTGITGSVSSSYNSSDHTGSITLSLGLTATGVTAGTYNRVTVDEYGRVTAADDDGSGDIEEPLTAGIAMLAARVGSLEDWLRDSWIDELGVGMLNAQETNTRKIWLSATAYLEVDENGYLHTNTPLYSDSWISAGGINTSGGGGGDLDLGAMWTSLTNGVILTEAVTSGTDIHPDHLPTLAIAGTHINGSVTSSYNSSTHSGSTVISLNLAPTGAIQGTYNSVTIDEYGRVLAGSVIDTEGPLAAGIAEAHARVASLEDWLRNPSLEEAYIGDLGAATGRFSGIVDIYGALNVSGLVTASAELKLAGTTKKLWFGDSAFIELDGNGYLHTNIGFYSDSWISAGGVNGSGTSGVDLGAVWTSLTNTTIATGSVTNNTHVNPAHLPSFTISGNGITGSVTSSYNTGTHTGAYTVSLALAASGVTAGTYRSVTVDTFGRVTAGTNPDTDDTPEPVTHGIADAEARLASLEDWLRNPSFDEVECGVMNADDFNLGRAITNAELANSSISIAGTAVSLGNAMSKEQLRSLLEINNVENTKLSTWPGSTNLTTLGTITTGVWNGTAIANMYLANSSISIAGTTVSLGGAMSKDQLRSLLEINNVENIKLSTWSGSTHITTVGYITTGEWRGVPIANTYLANSRIRINGEWVSLGDTYTTGGITPGTAGSSSSTSGLTFDIPYVSMSSYGIVTGWGTRTHSINAAQLVAGIGNNYVANANYATNAGYANSAGVATNANHADTADSATSATTAAKATGDERGNNIRSNYGASLTAASNALKLVAMSGDTLSTITAANLVTVLGNTAVNRATADANGNNIASTYFTVAGGTINGDIRLQSGNYGNALWFGDGQFAYIKEASDDVLTVYGDKGINLTTSGTNRAVSVANTLTVGSDTTIGGKLYLTSNAYLEYSSSNVGIHISKGIYSDGYVSAGGLNSSSDARLKKNMRPVTLTVRQVAVAPAIEFDWVDERTPGCGAGSIAQYWQELLPYNVHAFTEDGMLSMEYGNIALLSAITIARAVETQEQRIERLEARVKELEAKQTLTN